MVSQASTVRVSLIQYCCQEGVLQQHDASDGVKAGGGEGDGVQPAAALRSRVAHQLGEHVP